MPGTLTAPGAGRSLSPSTTALPVAGMQNVPESVVAKGFERSEPSGEPVSVILPASPPNAPGCVWPGQKFPAGSEAVEVPVVIGARATASRPLKPVAAGGHSMVVFLDPTPPLHGGVVDGLLDEQGATDEGQRDGDGEHGGAGHEDIATQVGRRLAGDVLDLQRHQANAP